MRLDCKFLERYHQDMVTACAWSPSDAELFTCSDDNTMKRLSADDQTSELVMRLSNDGAAIGKGKSNEENTTTVGNNTNMGNEKTGMGEDYYVTDMSWCPNLSEKQVSDVIAVSCTDGTFRILQGNGTREEKKVDAHKGCAVISIAWNSDGSAIATGGEDGMVKVWSRVGMLRNTVATTKHPVYCVRWGRNDEILYCSGKSLRIEQKERKQVEWKAHDGTVLCLDWNAVNNLIVSGGEDCKYRIWDSFGRQLFQSHALEDVITSIQWCPNGSCFAVGAFNVLRLCDRTGWSYCREEFDAKTGSLLNLAWSRDGTLLGGAGASGTVVIAQLAGRELEWKHMQVAVMDAKRIKVCDSLQDKTEEIEFRDRVIDVSMAWEHLVVYTSTPQVHVYNVHNLNAPHIFDVTTRCALVLQSSKLVMAGWNVYTYEGRRVCTSQCLNGINIRMLDRQTITINDTSIAVVENNRTSIRMIHVNKQQNMTFIQHTLEVLQLALSNHDDDVLAFIDRNRDVFVHRNGFRTYKLPTTTVESIAFNDVSDTLVACVDGGSKILAWQYPQVVWIDPDLLEDTNTEISTPQLSSQQPRIVSFWQNLIVVRKQDGAIVTTSVSPYPAMLYQLVLQQRKWEDAIRLCRFVNSKSLWATLAAAAIDYPHLDTAEIALAMTLHVDKLEYILYIKDIPSEKAQMAELALYKRDFPTAEKILLHANPPMLYRAVKMNIRFFRWDRAQEIGKKNKDLTRLIELYKTQWEKQEIDETTEKEFASLKKKFRDVSREHENRNDDDGDEEASASAGEAKSINDEDETKD